MARKQRTWEPPWRGESLAFVLFFAEIVVRDPQMTPNIHVGLIVPASNTVMEPDFHRAISNLTTTSTWRIVLESVTREAEVRMLEQELPRCLDGLRDTQPDIAVFGCTSAGSLDGLEHDAAIARSVASATGANAVTVMGAVVGELQALAGRRVAVFTPYREELTNSVAGCIAEAGYQVVTARGMGILDNREIGRVTPAEIVHFVTQGMQHKVADCVFLSCTNWQAIGAIDPLKRRLEMPVISSNQATIDNVRLLAQRFLDLEHP